MHLRYVVVLTAVSLLVCPWNRASCSEPQPPPGKGKAKTAEQDEEYYELLKVFVDTLDQVERNYVKDLSRRELLEAAIQGMVSKLDQYSNYISPDDLDYFRTSVENEFGGIGIQVVKEPGRHLQVISPLVGSPAYQAGVLAGDEITHIGGVNTKEMSRGDAIQQIKGAPGTQVELTVRQGANESRTLKLTREVVRIETVLGDRRDQDDQWHFMYDQEAKIGYIRVIGFAKHTASRLRKVLRQLEDAGLRGLMLDLRSNPGGLLSSAIEVADLFVAEGRIVSTEGRNTQPRVWDAHRRGTFTDFPMAVLVNGFSASASEIVAACLQDHQRAVVVGERTFGKGSVQNVIALENGRSALKLTTAGYKRPSGKNIHRFPDTPENGEWGVRPNAGFAVEVDLAEHRRLARLRHQRDIVSRHSASSGEDAEEEPALEQERPVDAVLSKALDYLRTQLSGELAASEVQEQPSKDDP